MFRRRRREQTQLRVVGAQPASVGSIEQNGITYMTVEYDYQLEKSDVRVAGVDSVQLPFDNAPTWAPVDHDEVAWLAQRGVPVPDPGSRQ